MRYLSPEWFDAASAALAADPGLPEATSEVDLTLEQTVTDAPGGPVRWRLRLDAGGAHLAVVGADGPDPGSGDADLRFTTTYATAAAIASGELGAPTAFIRGELKVGGDLTLLTSHQRRLAAVHDVLADVRKVTTFEAGGS